MNYRIKNLRKTPVLLLFLLGALSMGCSNYSSEPQIVNPPIILGISREGSGHILTVAAQNTELGFFGYRLFESTTEDDARTQAADNGTDCGTLNVLPNNAIEYIIEVKPDQTTVSPGSTDRLCVVTRSLTAGRYVALRSLIFNVTTITTSSSSNAVLVP